MLTGKAAQTGFLPFGAVDGVVLTGQLVDTFDRGEQAESEADVAEKTRSVR